MRIGRKSHDLDEAGKGETMATETARPKTEGNSPAASALTLAAWARFDDVTARLDRMEKRINERIDERFDRIEQLLRERTTP